MIEYATICENDHITFDKTVNFALKNGWVPFGSPFSRQLTNLPAQLVQVMIRVIDNPTAHAAWKKYQDLVSLQ